MFVFLALASTLGSTEGASDTDYIALLDHLEGERAWNIASSLTEDRFGGRLSGDRSAELASEFIAGHFGSIGLKPAGEGGNYRARFSVPLWQLTRVPELTLIDGSSRTLQSFGYRMDFAVRPGSGSGNFSAQVVFAGYGITAKELDYDDYGSTICEGKIVLAIVGTPSSSKFKESSHGAWNMKADNAVRHGAAALILIDNPSEPTPHFVERWAGGHTVYQKLVVLWATVRLAERLLAEDGFSLSPLQKLIDQDSKPQSLALNSRLRVSVQVTFAENADGYNVLGFVPGSDMASNRSVIIGAHYDHLGKDVDASIFRGANDDASGVAVMIEIARVLSTAARPRWNVLFAAWSGEEEGLRGSSAYVNSPVFPLADTVAYLNLDMVGYGRQLVCQISETHKMLRAVLAQSMEQLGGSIAVEKYSGGSDHACFEVSKVANLMFIRYPDEFYHTPRDTIDRIQRRDLLEVARLTLLMALKLSEAAEAIAAQTTIPHTGVTKSMITESSIHTSSYSMRTSESGTSISTLFSNDSNLIMIGIAVLSALSMIGMLHLKRRRVLHQNRNTGRRLRIYRPT